MCMSMCACMCVWCKRLYPLHVSLACVFEQELACRCAFTVVIYVHAFVFVCVYACTCVRYRGYRNSIWVFFQVDQMHLH